MQTLFKLCPITHDICFGQFCQNSYRLSLDVFMWRDNYSSTFDNSDSNMKNLPVAIKGTNKPLCLFEIFFASRFRSRYRVSLSLRHQIT